MPQETDAPADAPTAEVELKLAARPEDFDAIRGAKTVVARTVGEPRKRKLESTYYDTEDGRLARRGIALRVRKSGRSYVQTAKTATAADGQGGWLGRGEWEVPLPGARPDLTRFDDPTILEQIGVVMDGDLRPCYRTKIEREERILYDPEQGVEIELALDIGTVEAGSRSAPICEVELELKRGPAAALYRLAEQLCDRAQLSIETRSKAERAAALSDDHQPAWTKASKLAVPPEVTVTTAMAAIFREGYEQWLANQAAAMDGRDSEGVHQMRVALRRLRSTVQTFGTILVQDQRDWLRTELKWAGDGLGLARDWDVFLEETLPPVKAAFPDDAGLMRLRTLATAERDAGYHTARQTVADPRYTRLVLGFGAWLEEQGWYGTVGTPGDSPHDATVGDIAPKLLTKRLKQVHTRGRGFELQDEVGRHAVRIAVKKLRYAAESFRTLYPGSISDAYLKLLSKLQDSLGHQNDMAVAVGLLHRLRLAAGPSADPAVERGIALVEAWHARGVEGHEPQVQRLWADFIDTKPFWKKA